MTDAMFDVDVLCVGHASYDVSMLLDHHPEPDEKCIAVSLWACGGGPAANAAVTVARLGGTSAFMGYLGLAGYGRLHFEELMKEGVRTDLIVRGDAEIPFSVILAKKGGDRTVVNHRSRTPVLAKDAVDFSLCRPRVVLLDGHEPELSLELAIEARRRGITVVLDAGSVHEGTRRLLSKVGVIAASARFAEDFTGESDPMRALGNLAAISPLCVITLGRQGLVYRQGDESGRIPAFPVDVVDTTGAGDAFHGAFSLSIARGEPVWRALLKANAVGALCCTKLGARPGIPYREEVERFLRVRRDTIPSSDDFMDDPLTE